ncbi:kirola [Artemisia annua]|uniref:Kirola n=1 Tax=Artemisia annua TaxID=35608 RepID=A0A2U1MSV5_ARTAN|nr:kirola [Artemisia annua]
MGLSGTLVKSITIQSDGDVFHEIFRDRPHHISDMSPGCIKGVDLHDGEWGKVGSIINWNFFHDGKEKVAKEVIEAIDEEKRLVCFKVIGGDILEAYKNFLITVHVDTHGEENVVTWTFHYEKLNENIPEPDSLMDFVLSVTKDIETHHLPKSGNQEALRGTLVKSITIKSCGDVFHEIFRYRPHHISEMSPGSIKGVDLHEGEWGTVGSVINWDFFHDGKAKVAKEVIEAIDEEKRSVCFKVIGGDILEAYKNFLITVHVDTHGEENLVTWTFHYEKLNENIPEPDSLMDFVLSVTKDIETHHLPKPE